jgi:hypothetical protein
VIHAVLPRQTLPFGARRSPEDGHRHRGPSSVSSQPYWQFVLAHVLESAKVQRIISLYSLKYYETISEFWDVKCHPWFLV